jgi:hypothetical protein
MNRNTNTVGAGSDTTNRIITAFSKIDSQLDDFNNGRSPKILSRIAKHSNGYPPESIQGELQYVIFLIGAVAVILDEDREIGVLSYEQIHSIQDKLESALISTIPTNFAPLFLAGRIFQQIKIGIVNLEDDTYDPQIQSNRLTAESMEYNHQSLMIANELGNKTISMLGDLLEAANRRTAEDNAKKEKDNHSDNSENEADTSDNSDNSHNSDNE